MTAIDRGGRATPACASRIAGVRAGRGLALAPAPDLALVSTLTLALVACRALPPGAPTGEPAARVPASSPTAPRVPVEPTAAPPLPAAYPPPEPRLHDAIEGVGGGTFVESGAGWPWGAPGEPFRVDVVALRGADGMLDLGVVVSDAATSRLVWSLGRDGGEARRIDSLAPQAVRVTLPPPSAGPTGAREPDAAAATAAADTAAVVTAGGARWLVVLRRRVVGGTDAAPAAPAAGGTPPDASPSTAPLPGATDLDIQVSATLALDGVAFVPDPGSVEVDRSDWTGDGTPDAALASRDFRTLILYAGPADGPPAPPAARVDWPGQVVDVEGDGRFEIVTPAGAQWRVEAWDGQAFVAAAPIPAALPAPAPVVDGALPPLPRDLLFVRGSEVWRWPRAGGALARVMPDPTVGRADGWRGGPPRFTRFRVARDGGQIAYPLGRFEKAGAERYDVEVTELFVFDPASGATTRVAADIPDNLPGRGLPGVDFFAIAPEGNEVVFVGPPRDGGRFAGAVYAAPVADAGAARVLADCGPSDTVGSASRGGCDGLLLAPTGEWAAFSDAGGLHVVDLAGGPPRTLAAVVSETQGGVEGVHLPRSWSPDGRFLITSVGYFEGSGNVVWDVETGTPRDLWVFEYVGPGSDLGWLSDGSAALEARDGAAPLRRFDLAAGAEGGGWRPVLGFLSGPRDADGGGYLAFAPHGLADGEIGFALRQSATDLFWGNGLFRVGPDGRGWRPIAALPPGAAYENGRFRHDLRGQVTWSPDGAAFVFVDLDPADGSVQTVLVGRTTGGDAVWEATALIGGDDGFAWGGGE